MEWDRHLSLSSFLILLPILAILVTACKRVETESLNTSTPTITSPTLLAEPTRTLSLERPDTVRATYVVKATQDALKPPSLTPNPSATPKPSVTPTPSIQPTRVEMSTLVPSFTSFRMGELTLEDYILAPESEFAYSSDDLENTWEFLYRIPDMIYDRRKETWVSVPEPDLTLSKINQRLSAFGYRAQEMDPEGGWTIYGLFQGQNLIQGDIRTFRKILVNPSGTDFALIFNHGTSRDLGYARKGFIDPWWNTMGGYDWLDEVDLAFFIGDDLIRVNFTDSPIVIKNDEIVYTHAITYMGPSHCPLISFQRWNDQWVMEVDGDVIINGEPLHQKYGYETAFHWQLLNGKPLFIFEKDGRFGISFNGQALPVEFDEIVYTMCGERLLPPTLGPWGNSRIVGFYGRKEGFWHYFELGPF
jgi:hypothetical protein